MWRMGYNPADEEKRLLRRIFWYRLRRYVRRVSMRVGFVCLLVAAAFAVFQLVSLGLRVVTFTIK